MQNHGDFEDERPMKRQRTDVIPTFSITYASSQGMQLGPGAPTNNQLHSLVDGLDLPGRSVSPSTQQLEHSALNSLGSLFSSGGLLRQQTPASSSLGHDAPQVAVRRRARVREGDEGSSGSPPMAEQGQSSPPEDHYDESESGSQDKKMTRLEKNRLSAALSRQRKREQLQVLQGELASEKDSVRILKCQLEESQNQLILVRASMAAIESENKTLREQVAAYKAETAASQEVASDQSLPDQRSYPDNAGMILERKPLAAQLREQTFMQQYSNNEHDPLGVNIPDQLDDLYLGSLPDWSGHAKYGDWSGHAKYGSASISDAAAASNVYQGFSGGGLYYQQFPSANSYPRGGDIPPSTGSSLGPNSSSAGTGHAPWGDSLLMSLLN